MLPCEEFQKQGRLNKKRAEAEVFRALPRTFFGSVQQASDMCTTEMAPSAQMDPEGQR